MADIRFFKYTGGAYGLTPIHTLFERWTLENNQEALFLGEPEPLVCVGRSVPFDVYNPDPGVRFCRLIQASSCAMYVGGDSLGINLSIRSEDKAALEAGLRRWISNAFAACGIPAEINDFAIFSGDKTTGYLSPPCAFDGLFVTGAVVFFSYDTKLSREVLAGASVPLEKISGINDLGYGCTKDQLGRALESGFSKDMQGELVPESLDYIRAELEALNADHLKADWIEQGVI